MKSKKLHTDECYVCIISLICSVLAFLALMSWPWPWGHGLGHDGGGLVNIRGLKTGLVTLPQGNEKPLVAKTRMEDASWAWGEQVSGMRYFPFSTPTLLVGQQEGHPACKKPGVGLLVVTMWLQQPIKFISLRQCKAKPPCLQKQK